MERVCYSWDSIQKQGFQIMVGYEWVVEWTDKHTDIQDHERSDKLREVYPPQLDADGDRTGCIPVLVLVRSEGNEHEGVTHRCWAYITPGMKYGVKFTDEWGHHNGYVIPKRFFAELMSNGLS